MAKRKPKKIYIIVDRQDGSTHIFTTLNEALSFKQGNPYRVFKESLISQPPS